jgi:hypothetical protein
MTALTKHIWLDFDGAKHREEVLQNLSTAALAGPFLWTASDEKRSLECLAPYRGGYRLHRQLWLDDVFPGLPGSKKDEADIEAIDIVDGYLWICGSHCLVRRQVRKTGDGRVHARLRARKSRRLLGVAKLTESLDDVERPGAHLPFKGKHSLLSMLARNRFLQPFLDLPSKENGFDIEGLAVTGSSALLGLRGPLVDSTAIVVELTLTWQAGLEATGVRLHFLDLQGLGVRDLTRWGKDTLILAGPVSAAAGPFYLFRWRRQQTRDIQKPTRLAWEHNRPGSPEAMCRLNSGLLLLCDVGTNLERVRGSRYRADLFAGSIVKSRARS